MLNTEDMKRIQDRRDIIADAIARIDGDLNFGTTVEVDGQTYHVTIVQED